MPDYQNGKVYKIIAKDPSDELGDMYVGSTCLALSSRMSQHRHKARTGETRKICEWLRDIGLNNAQIILVENYACNGKEQLRQREQYWKEELQPSLNTRNAYVSREDRMLREREYYEQNKEQRRQYLQQNKEQIAEKKRQYREQNIEQIRQYLKQNKEHIVEYKRQYRQQNKVKIAEYQRQYRERKHLERIEARANSVAMVFWQ